jgi:hypothetical protein
MQMGRLEEVVLAEEGHTCMLYKSAEKSIMEVILLKGPPYLKHSVPYATHWHFSYSSRNFQ